MHKPLIGIILLATIIRLWYISYSGNEIVLKPDSQGYYGEKQFFNPNRTPGYSMLTSFVLKQEPQYGSPLFLEQAKILIYIQTIVGLISLIVLYDTLLALKVARGISLAFTVFTAINIYQFIWDRAFLTESLYISLFIILMRLFVALLHAPTMWTGVTFVLLSGYEFLLRPAGLMIPYLVLPIVWLSHKTKKVLHMTLFLLLLYTAIPGTYIAMNKYLHNFKGVGYNTDFSVFGRILLFDIPIDSARSVTNLYQKVNEYRAVGGNVSIPWYFFVYYNNEVYGKLSEVQEFNKLVIGGQPWKFALSVIQDIPKAFFDTEVYGVLYRSSNPSIARVFFDGLDWMIRVLQKSTIIFLVLFPYSVWVYLKKPTKLHAFLLGIGMIQVYQLFSSLIFGGAWEFARHMITTQTYLFFFCFWWIKTLWRRS